MSYLIKDLIYDNRWVEMPNLTIKFANSIAEVPDSCIDYFKKNTKEFVVIRQIAVDRVEEAPEVKPIVVKTKSKKT